MCSKYYRNCSAFVETIVKWKRVTLLLDHSVVCFCSIHVLQYALIGWTAICFSNLRTLFDITAWQMLVPHIYEIRQQNLVVTITKHRLHNPFSASNCYAMPGRQTQTAMLTIWLWITLLFAHLNIIKHAINGYNYVIIYLGKCTLETPQ